MRRCSLCALPGIVIATACGAEDLPNARLYFTTGEEKEAVTYKGVARFDVERIDASGDADRISRDAELPEAVDLGAEGAYDYRARGFDDEGRYVAAGRTLRLLLSALEGSSIPLFMARTDRASRPSGELALVPGVYPPAAVLRGGLVWVMNGGEESIETDSYSFAVWRQNTPPGGFKSITCPQSPCELTNLVVSGGVYAVALSSHWAFAMDTSKFLGVDFPAPDDLESWGNVAGGRVLPGENQTALLAGAARFEAPTDYWVLFEDAAQTTVFRSNTPRAGASVLFEPAFGIVVAGGSAEGPGVEVRAPNEEKFTSLDYPSDSVVGAALAVEDDEHILRMGGATSEGEPAPTVRIDLECQADCELEAVPELDVAAHRAHGYYDADTGVTLIVGEDSDGVMVAYRFDGEALSTIAFPEAQKRKRATTVELPNQQLMFVGGLDIEDEDPMTTLSVVSF